MSNYPKNTTLLYKQELCRWHDYLRSKQYPEKYIQETLAIWRNAAQRSSGGHWRAYHDALEEIDKQREKVN